MPDAGRMFAATLVVHIASRLTTVVAGALAATTKTRPGRILVPAASTYGHWPASSPPPPP
jgi:hypothetical protein